MGGGGLIPFVFGGTITYRSNRSFNIPTADPPQAFESFVLPGGTDRQLIILDPIHTNNTCLIKAGFTK